MRNVQKTESRRKDRTMVVAPALLLALALTGCQKNSTTLPSLAATRPQDPKLNLSAPGGVAVAPVGGPMTPQKLLEGKTFVSRTDPFALMNQEAAFDELQAAERLLSESSWNNEVEPTLEMTDEPIIVVERLPAWRLAGVVIGNGVIALLDVGGKVYDIRPGSKVPGTEWTVASIDQERAILVREGNKLPKQFEVGLQGPILRPGQ